jgi:nucleoside 2-deoxyribosyltransferase
LSIINIKAERMKNIYFAGSIRGGRGDAALYKQIIDELRNYGAVLTEHIGAEDAGSGSEAELSDKEIHDRDMDWLTNSDIIVAEVTTPSLGVGYEIGRAVALGKRVICLYRKQGDAQLSAMIGGSEGAEAFYYETIEDTKKILSGVFE